MKKVMLMLAVVLVSTCCFAQKKAVATAKNKAMNSETPDFAGARDAIKPALTDPETKDQANTWYVAGLIGYKEFEHEDVQRMIGQTYDEKKWAEAAYDSYKYWMVADSLSQVLVADKKGNMKPQDPKIRKQIAEKMIEYFQKQCILSYAFEQNKIKDEEAAYEAATAHLNIPNLEMLKNDEKAQQKMVRDTNYYTYKYYSGIFAYEAKRYDDAIRIFTQVANDDRAKALPADAAHAMEYLCMIHKDQKDTTGYIAALKEGFQKFPQEPWFVQNLINCYLQDLNDEKAALDYVDQAIASDPQLQYYNLKGELFIRANKFDEAIAIFQDINKKDASYAPAWDGLGRAYYFKAYTAEEDAQNITDNKAYKAALAAARQLYEPAIEPLKKAIELDKTDRNAMILLKNSYYKLGRMEESQKIQEMLNN